MNFDKMQTILNKIKEYDSIIIFRHKRPDGDAVGSTNGLAEIIRASFENKKIYLASLDTSEFLAFLGSKEEEVSDEQLAESLGIVVDTATAARVSNPKFSLCRETVKIDHHIPVESYATYEWVEEERSSACEMIAHFYDTFKNELTLTSRAATFIYTGMVTDSGRFRFRGVSGDTMRLAGLMLDAGIDTDTIYANLYLKDFDNLKFEGYLQKKMKITDGGVAYLHVTKGMQKRFKLSSEDASATVSIMEKIKGSIIWIAFIDNADGSIRVRLRSRFVTVSELAERYHGGGHACASGATVYSKKEMAALIAEANALIKEYKANNEGWL